MASLVAIERELKARLRLGCDAPRNPAPISDIALNEHRMLNAVSRLLTLRCIRSGPIPELVSTSSWNGMQVSNPTSQWLSKGNPCRSVLWGEQLPFSWRVARFQADFAFSRLEGSTCMKRSGIRRPRLAASVPPAGSATRRGRSSRRSLRSRPRCVHRAGARCCTTVKDRVRCPDRQAWS
jgi:hypothetical protein